MLGCAASSSPSESCPDVRGGVVARLSQRGRRNVGRAHTGEHLAGFRVLEGGHAGVHGLERRIERVGRGGSRRDGRVVRSADGVVAGVVHHLLHAVLLHGLHELRRDEAVGLRRVRHVHELAAHEEGHQQEQDDGNDGRPGIRLLELRLLVVVLLCHSVCAFSFPKPCRLPPLAYQRGCARIALRAAPRPSGGRQASTDAGAAPLVAARASECRCRAGCGSVPQSPGRTRR